VVQQGLAICRNQILLDAGADFGFQAGGREIGQATPGRPAAARPAIDAVSMMCPLPCRIIMGSGGCEAMHHTADIDVDDRVPRRQD
jgi:hypothetical protein